MIFRVNKVASLNTGIGGILILLLHIFLITPLNAQMFYHKDDTIAIKEIVIGRQITSSEIFGYKQTIIDSSILSQYSHSSLSEVLRQNSNLFIKDYGPGFIATPTFRGTGANHTIVSWNGININHPMLGQSDFSIIPAGFMDDIQILFGGSSMMLGSGGIGGMINMETKPEWGKRTSITINPGIGSFGRYTGSINIKTGNNNFQSVTKAYISSTENDFGFNYEGKDSIRSNCQVQQNGFIQEFYLREKNLMSAKFWYQNSDRNLPWIAKQFDESLRLLLNYKADGGVMNYFLTSAYLMTKLNYINELDHESDSRSLTHSIIIKSGFNGQINHNTSYNLLFDNETGYVESNKYNKNHIRNKATLTALIKKEYNKGLGINLMIKEIVDRDVILIPDFSIGTQFGIPDKEHFFKANISRNTRIPTLNELFWPPGNPELKNEYAYTGELTYNSEQRISSTTSYKYSFTVFNNIINNYIQWVQNPSIAKNIKKVNSSGIEASFEANHKFNNHKIDFIAGYSYTRARTVESESGNDIGYQLIYIPEHNANASLSFGVGKFYSSWITTVTGNRYITSDNNKNLPGYLLNYFKTGFNINIKNNYSIGIGLTVNNLFDVDYYIIENYPMPGRSYEAKISVQIIK